MKKFKLIPLFLASSMLLGGCTLPSWLSWLPFGDKAEEGQKEEEKKEEGDTKKKYDINPEIVGGTEAERTAIIEAVNKKPICQQFGKSSVTVFPDSEVKLEEHKYQHIKLTTKQKMGTDLFVYFTWSVNEEQEYFQKIHHLPDGAHDLLEIKYKGYGAADGSITWSLTKMVCGDAVSETKIDYSATVKNETYIHDEMTLAQLYAVTPGPSTWTVDGLDYTYPATFDIIDYSTNSRNQGAYSPFFRPNNPDAKEDNDYHYVSVCGKVIYTSPDGNWGLLADGKNVLEFYSGSGTGFVLDNWPCLADQYVRIQGNLALYKGNIQLGYVTKIATLTAEEKALIAEPEPLAYRDMSESVLAALKVPGYTNELHAATYEDGCLMNSLGEVSGTLVADSLKVGDNAASADELKNAERCTFVLKVGDGQLTVAYDYHTDRDGKHGVIAALKTVLKGTGTITIKGTMRYSSDQGIKAGSDNKGVWNIVPFWADQISIA